MNLSSPGPQALWLSGALTVFSLVSELRKCVPQFRLCLLTVSQRVWLSAKDLPLKVESRKLAPRYVGPFRIIWRVNPVTYQLELPRSMKVNPVFHVSLLKPVLASSLSPPSAPPLRHPAS